MKNNIFLTALFSLIFTFSVSCQTNENKTRVCEFLSATDAEKILGKSVELVESFNDKEKYKCNYRRIEKDNLSGQEVNLFFMLEESLNEEQAKQIYQTIWNSNKNHQGVEVLNGLGDEAYTHSDSPNFHFVITRKGKFTIRLKVNKAVEGTSLTELKAFAKRFITEI